jgi:hypothetical protein
VVGREVEVIPGKDLLFTWRSKRKLFDLVEVRTERQFAEKMAELAKADQLNDELTVKMYCIGFNWRKDGPVVSPEETEEIIEEFCQVNGFGTTEVYDKLIDAFCESGIYNKAVILASRKLRDQMKNGELPQIEPPQEDKGADMGEDGKTLTSMS